MVKMKPLQVFFFPPNGQTICLRLNPYLMVSDVKELIYDRTGICPSQQMLLAKSGRLKVNQLSDCMFMEVAVFVCI